MDNLTQLAAAPARFPSRIVDRDGVCVCVALAGASCLSITFRGHSLILDAIAASAMGRALNLFLADADPISRFVAECLRAAPGKRVPATVLYQVFSAWARASGEEELKQNMLGRLLRARGYVAKVSCITYWLDAELSETGRKLLASCEEYCSSSAKNLTG